MNRRSENRAGMRKQIRRLLKQKQGVTIVELIITFLLIVIFTTGSCRLMADSMKIYNKIRALNDAQQVMDTVLDKVTGELEGAQVNMRGLEEGADDTGATLTIKEDAVHLYDRTSSAITISADGDPKVMVIRYDRVTGSGGAEAYKAVDWKFDPAMYMGFEVQELKFSRAGEEYPKNVVRVDLTLTSMQGYGTFKNTRYVECYNFESDQDMNKIAWE